MRMRKRLLTGLHCAVLAAAAGIVALPPALAQEQNSEPDHELARQALQRKEILPLDQVLGAIRDRMPGEIVEIELERDQGRWIYEVEVVDETGRMRDVLVDAKDAKIIRTEDDD
jgi:uncharacterized membrane protein YkoI